MLVQIWSTTHGRAEGKEQTQKWRLRDDKVWGGSMEVEAQKLLISARSKPSLALRRNFRSGAEGECIKHIAGVYNIA